jgi:hypothetical protein
MNAIPGTYCGHLASPFLLVHGIGHNERTWIPLFSLCYFHHKKDSDQQLSKHQARTMYGIVIDRSSILNALMVYNLCNQQYYEPDSYHINPYCLPTLVYPDIKYDGGLFCYLLCDENPHMEEKYPRGTQIEQTDPSTNMLLSGMVMDIPFPRTSADRPLCNLSYMVLFDNGSTTSIPLQDIALLIPPPPVNPSSVGDSLSSQDSLLPPFFCIISKITHKHEGQYHKCYLMNHDSSYGVSFKSHINKKNEDWGINLPNPVMNWVDLCIEGVLIPGHISHTFLRSPSSSAPTTFDPMTSFVSSINFHLECPPSLLKALAHSHPDREVWLRSFFEEKRGIQGMNTYGKITLGKYCTLCEKGAPKAIPTMCVLTVKRDENLNPLQEKSRIVVLGNHEDHVWRKSNCFAPVLCSNSLWFLVSMAVKKRHLLHPGHCKNTFCQGILPPEEVTII